MSAELDAWLAEQKDPGLAARKALYEEGKATRVVTGSTVVKIGPDGGKTVPTYDYIVKEPVAQAQSQPQQSAPVPDQRSTGEYNDVMNSLQIDQQAAVARAEELKAQQAQEYQASFDELTTGFNQQIDQLNAANAEQINQLNAANAANVASLNQRYEQQAAQFNRFQDLAADQLATAQANYRDQRKMTENLRSAFVPEPNPSALTASIGDQRTDSTRKTRDNRLSDLSSLSIVSGLGTASNPLSGLQLA